MEEESDGEGVLVPSLGSLKKRRRPFAAFFVWLFDLCWFRKTNVFFARFLFEERVCWFCLSFGLVCLRLQSCFRSVLYLFYLFVCLFACLRVCLFYFLGFSVSISQEFAVWAEKVTLKGQLVAFFWGFPLKRDLCLDFWDYLGLT